MFGFIKNFFNAIIGFITGFFGSKKSQDNQLKPAKAKKSGGYYMQLEESESQPETAAKSTASKSDAPEPSTKAKPQPAAKAEPAPKAEPAATKAEKTPETAPKPEPKPEQVRVELVQGAEGLKAEPVKEPVTTAANNGKAASASKTFATDYLIQPSTSAPRRRPGANMNSYLDMARQVKAPS
ncbi:MAG TPA: hypothetical protein V6D15_22790 [Oculatellaceae cyanobacterium]|jgi:outer membrane biosynthesis protein TonB